jgi:hypothetical protein
VIERDVFESVQNLLNKWERDADKYEPSPLIDGQTGVTGRFAGQLRAALEADRAARETGHKGLHPMWVKVDRDGRVLDGFYTESGPNMMKVWIDVGAAARPATKGEENG